MQEVFLLKKCESAENGTAVDGGKVHIKLFKREGSTELLYASENEQAHSRGAYTVELQYIFVFVCFHRKYACAKKSLVTPAKIHYFQQHTASKRAFATDLQKINITFAGQIIKSERI